MPPEKVSKVSVLDLDGGDPPRARRYTATAGAEFLVKWYPLKKKPVGFQPVAGGVIFVPEEVRVSEGEEIDLPSTPRSCRYRDELDMLVLTLPRGQTLSWREPPRAAKEFDGRLALYWLSASPLSEVVWKLSPADKAAAALAQDINGFLEDERGDVPTFSIDDYESYDVALSYASEDRKIAAQIAERLARASVHVFFDDRDPAHLLGKQIGPELHAIYSKRSMFCVVLVSAHYAQKRWPLAELKAVLQGMERTGRRDVIIPVQLDSTVLEELPGDIASISINRGVESIAATIVEKVHRDVS